MLVKVSAKIFYNALINLFLNIPKSVCFRTVFYVPTLVYQFLTEITLSPCTLSICFFKVITTPKVNSQWLHCFRSILMEEKSKFYS